LYKKWGRTLIDMGFILFSMELDRVDEGPTDVWKDKTG